MLTVNLTAFSIYCTHQIDVSSYEIYVKANNKANLSGNCYVCFAHKHDIYKVTYVCKEN